MTGKLTGVLSVSFPDADPDEEPIETGTWRVKETEAKKGDDSEEIKRQNEGLSYLYGQSFENWTTKHELCYEMVQESFDKVGDTDEKSPRRSRSATARPGPRRVRLLSPRSEVGTHLDSS